MSCARNRCFGIALILLWACAPVGQAEQTRADASTPAKTLVPPLPSRPVPELTEDLDSADPSVRAEAARELAGARRLPERVWGSLTRLGRDDPERAVRLAAERARYLLVIHGVRASIGDAYDQPPRPIRMDSPRYPQAARQRRISGIVRVLVLVNEQGDVEDAEIIESIAGLDEAALRCVRDWKFEPATKDGRATPAYAIAPLSFSLTTDVIRF